MDEVKIKTKRLNLWLTNYTNFVQYRLSMSNSQMSRGKTVFSCEQFSYKYSNTS